LGERVKPGLWIQAQLRRCNSDAIPAVVSRRGDPDAGSILLKIARRDGVSVYAQASGRDGEAGWVRGAGPIAEADADAYIARQAKRDPDLWVVEIEDPAGRYSLDGKVL
jgi:hypothetical protein